MVLDWQRLTEHEGMEVEVSQIAATWESLEGAGEDWAP